MFANKLRAAKKRTVSHTKKPGIRFSSIFVALALKKFKRPALFVFGQGTKSVLCRGICEIL